MANNKKEWQVFNETDGFFADPNLFTFKQAERFIKDFPLRYKKQGHYRNSLGININPEEVVLLIRKYNPK